MKQLFILILLLSCLCYAGLDLDNNRQKPVPDNNFPVKIVNYNYFTTIHKHFHYNITHCNYFFDNPRYNYFDTFIRYNNSYYFPQNNLRYSYRYINDLGHDFLVRSWVAGSYWSGGDWGSKNNLTFY